MRAAATEQLADADDEQFGDLVEDHLGISADQMEGVLQALGQIGQALGAAAPAIAGGASTGATIGSVVPGIGTGIGAGVGAIAGGLSSVLSKLGSSSGRPARPASARPAPSPAAPPRPATPSPSLPDPSAHAALLLLYTLLNPATLQAISSLALGSQGIPSVEVVGRQVPVGAFAELVSELAQETMMARPLPGGGSSASYLEDVSGEFLVDPASPPDRAGALLGLLQIEAAAEDDTFITENAEYLPQWAAAAYGLERA